MKTTTANPLRAALSKGRLLRGAFQVLTDRAVTEIVLGSGFEFVLVDAEHRPMNPETVEDIVRTAKGMGKAAIARVPLLSRGAIQYVLETGADGVLVPLVGSRAQAEEVVSLSRYPPLGTRGFNGATRASGWGSLPPAEYAKAAARSVVVAAQIETVEGVEAVDEIATVDGLDMLFVGPFDLSHSLGLTGQLGHQDVRAAIARVFRAGREHGKWLGVLATEVEFAQWCVGQGVRFLVYRSDVRFLKQTAMNEFNALTPVTKETSKGRRQ